MLFCLVVAIAKVILLGNLLCIDNDKTAVNISEMHPFFIEEAKLAHPN